MRKWPANGRLVALPAVMEPARLALVEDWGTPMRRWVHRIVAIAIVLSGSLGVAVVIPSPAHAALPRCTGASIVGNNGGTSIVPSQGTNTGQVSCALGDGDRYLGVMILQRALNYCHQAGLAEDGIYGELTRNAVIFMQAVAKNRGAPIVVDGWYGPKTATYAVKFQVLGGPQNGTCSHFIRVI